MSCRTRFPILLAFFASVVVARAQPYVQVMEVEHDAMKFHLNNNGIFGYNPVDSSRGLTYSYEGYAVPYLSGGGLWFSTRRQKEGGVFDTLVFSTFDPGRRSSQATPGGWTTEAPRLEDSALNGIYDSRRYQRMTGQPYPGSDELPAWPLWERGYGSFPEWTSPQRPGRFIADTALRNTDSSGRVAIGHPPQFFSRYHDGVLEQYGDEAAPGHPIGLEVEQNVYTFSQPGLNGSQLGAWSHLVVHYRVINFSGDTLRDSYLSTMLDPGLGARVDNDHVGLSPDGRIAYAWSDAESSGGTPGTLALFLLEGPFVDADSRSPNYRFIADRYRIYNDTMVHMEVGVHSFRSWTSSEPDPLGSRQRYEFVAAKRFDEDSTAGERRMLLNIGPFNMRPLDTAIYAVGIAVIPFEHGPLAARENPMSGLRGDVEELYRIGYYLSVAESRVDGSAIRLYPNPAGDRADVAFELGAPSTVALCLRNMLGETVRVYPGKMLGAGSQSISIDLDGVPSGVFLLSVETASGRAVEKLVVR